MNENHQELTWRQEFDWADNHIHGERYTDSPRLTHFLAKKEVLEIRGPARLGGMYGKTVLYREFSSLKAMNIDDQMLFEHLSHFKMISISSAIVRILSGDEGNSCSEKGIPCSTRTIYQGPVLPHCWLSFMVGFTLARVIG